MQQYRSMTAQEAIDEVFIRLGRYKTGINLDWQSAMLFLSNARREAVNRTLPHKQWYYVLRTNVVDGQQMPAEFVRPIRCVLSPDGNTELREARLIEVPEVWTVTNECRPHAWNRGVQMYPVYWFWGERSQQFTDAARWNGQRVMFHCHPRTSTGILEYQAQYTDITNDLQQLNIPYEMEQLVILMTLERAMFKVGLKDKLPYVSQSIASEMRSLNRRFVAKDQAEGIGLQAIPDPQPAQIVPTQTGNLRR